MVNNYQDPDQLMGFFEREGIPWGELTPEQEFAAYATTAFRPGPSRLRSAAYNVRDPMLQAYYLAQPMMMGDATTGPYGGFRDWMQSAVSDPGYTGAFGQAAQGAMRTRAQQAAVAAGMPGAQFFQYLDPQADYTGPEITEAQRLSLEAMSPEQLLMYRQRYGTGEQAAANQAALANMLALQRTAVPGQAGPGRGFYGGEMGRAITSAMGELRGQLLARDPERNFLDWYLQRTGGGGGPAGFIENR